MTRSRAVSRSRSVRARARIRAGIAIALWTVLAVGSWRPAPAQLRPKQILLKAEVTTRFSTYRLGGPLPLEVKLTWKGTSVLEGRLHIVIRDVVLRLSQIQTPELALAPGETTFRVLLPPPIPSEGGSSCFAHLSFVGARGAIDLGRTSVTLPETAHRTLVIGLARQPGRMQPGVKRLAERLRLDRFNPDRTQPESVYRISTSLVPTPVLDLPGDPLALCAYDLLVIDAESLAALKEPQVVSLQAWIRAGGAALVMIDRAGTFEPYHVAFLNALVEEAEPSYTLDDDGRLSLEDTASPIWRRLHPELGRVVIVQGPLDPAGNARTDAEIDRTAVFLWRIRRSQALSMISRGRWSVPAVSLQWGQLDQSYGWRPLQFGLSEVVLPAEIELIPLGLLALILGLFLLCIGPLDYLLLGWLRARWLTWIVFPLTCAAFTVVTVAVANRYLGHTRHRQSLVFTDVSARGEVLRESRFDLIFSGTQQQAVRQGKNSLFAVVAPDQFTGDGLHALNMSMRRQWGGSRSHVMSPPWITGHLTGSYETRRTLWKWTPMAERTTRLAPGGAAPVFDQETFDVNDLLQGMARDPESCADLILSLCRRAGFDPGDVVLVQMLHGEDTELLHETEIAPPRDGEMRGLTTKKLGELIEKVSRRGSSSRFFKLVSAISPTGSGQFEDLAVLDPENRDQAVLVIVVRRGEDLVICRRFFWKR